MAVEGQNSQVSILAGADLRSGAQFKVVAVAGTIAATNATALGVLQNRPNTNENAAVAYAGHMKAYVGGAVSAGNSVKVTTSGFLIAISSGDTSVAKAITAAASGALCEIVASFINPSQQTYS